MLNPTAFVSWVHFCATTNKSPPASAGLFHHQIVIIIKKKENNDGRILFFANSIVLGNENITMNMNPQAEIRTYWTS